MSSIDKRVVEMGFNNAQFESGVRTSLKSLDNLKKGLQLEESAKNLQNLEKVGKAFSLQNIADSVNNISSRFSILGVVGFTILQNLTNAALGLAKSLAESLLGLNAIKAGMGGYETKVNAVKTVMSGTGESIDEVTKSLNELNQYSDRTVYSFEDMTANISKFTNAGLKSKEAAIAIQGISNVAALSGANTNEAARAMYNFGQALSQGSVRLMDWKSIELANMATIEFKTQLIQTGEAMGTLKKQTDGTWKTLKGTTVTSTLFNESLADQWLTTNVLIKTLSDYASQETEIGKKANAAAVQLKTYTQLMDNIADSQKTSWIKSFEYIFGDLNEATELWSYLGDTITGFLGQSAAARNQILKDWHDLGGRAMLFETLKMGIENVLKVINVFKEAFSEIFPPMTGLSLVNLTIDLYRFVKGLTLSNETLQKLKTIFKGVASALDIVGRIAGAAFKGIFGLLSGLNIPSGASALLDFFAGIARKIYLFDVALKTWGIEGVIWSKRFDGIRDVVLSVVSTFEKLYSTVKKAVEPFVWLAQSAIDAGIGSVEFWEVFKSIFGEDSQRFIENMISSIKNFGDTVGKAFQKIKDAFGKIDLSGLRNFIQGIHISIEPLRAIATVLAAIINGIVTLTLNVAPYFKKLGSIIATTLGNMASSIFDAVKQLDFGKVFAIINTGLIGALILGIRKFMGSGAGAFEGASGLMDGVTGLLDGVGDSLRTWQESLKAKTLLTIAGAIGILAVSLLVLSGIPAEKLMAASIAITAMFANLVASMNLMSKTGSSTKMAAQMVLMSVAILILAGALRSIASVSQTDIDKGIAGVVALTTTLVGFSAAMSKISGGTTKSVVNMVILAVALKLLVGVVKDLGAIDIEQLKQGLLSVGALLVELALFMQLTSNASMSIGKGVGLILIAAALNILATAVQRFSEFDPQKLGQGLMGLGAALAELAIFVKATSNAKGVITTAIGLTILGAAMLIFSEAISRMGQMQWDVIGRGLATMAGALAIVTATIKMMPKNTIATAIGLAIIAGSLLVLGKALSSMGGMTWDEIARGMVTLAGSLAVITLAMLGMKGALSGAAAMVIMVGALGMLVPLLKILGGMSLIEIGTALLALAGTFAVIGIAGLLLGPLVPVLFALAGAMFLFALATVAVGVGITAFAAGLAMLAVSGAAGAAALATIIMTLVGLIPMVIAQLVAGIVAFATQIAAAAPTLVAALLSVLMAMALGILQSIPQFISVMAEIVTTILTTLASKAPEIIQAGMDLLVSLLKGIADNIQDVVESAVDVVTNFIEGVANKLPDIIQSGVDLLVAFLDGIANGIRDNQDRIITSMGNLADAMIDGLVAGLTAGLHKITEVITGIGQGALATLKGVLGIQSPSKEFKSIAKFSVQGLIDGLILYGKNVAAAAADVGKTALEGLKSTLSDISNAVSDSMDVNPTIKPVLDLSDIVSGGKTLNDILGQSLDLSGSAALSSMLADNGGNTATNQDLTGGVKSITFEQNNYSPKALSRLEIYRQTKNQVLALKGLVK